MEEKFTRDIGSFAATDADGNVVIIHIIQTYFRYRNALGYQTREGQQDLVTSDSLSVERIGKGIYDVLVLDMEVDKVRVTSDDLNAP